MELQALVKTFSALSGDTVAYILDKAGKASTMEYQEDGSFVVVIPKTRNLQSDMLTQYGIRDTTTN